MKASQKGALVVLGVALCAGVWLLGGDDASPSAPTGSGQAVVTPKGPGTGTTAPDDALERPDDPTGGAAGDGGEGDRDGLQVRAPTGDAPSTSTIAGRGALRGVVVSLEGAPLPEASVALLSGEDTLARARCGLDGSFLLEGLEPGRYVVRARAPGRGAAEEAIALPTSDALRFALGRARRVQGRVVREGGGVVGAGIGVLVDGRQWAFTDAQGAFVLEELDADQPLRLSARGEQWVSKARVELPASPDDANDVVLAVVEGSSLEVTVEGDGAPLSNANVRTVSEDGMDPTAYGQTGPDGKTTLDGLLAGPQRLLVTAEGWLEREQELSLSGSVTRLRVELKRGASVGGQIVRGASGVPAARLGLARVGEDGEPPEDEILTAESGPDGAFRFSGLLSGTYRLRHYAELTDGNRRTVTLLETVTVGADEARALDLQLPEPDAQGTLAGRVRGAGPGVRVEVWRESSEGVELTRTVSWTDAGGGYRIDGLGAGAYRVSVADGEPTDVVVAAGQVTRRDFDSKR